MSVIELGLGEVKRVLFQRRLTILVRVVDLGGQLTHMGFHCFEISGLLVLDRVVSGHVSGGCQDVVLIVFEADILHCVSGKVVNIRRHHDPRHPDAYARTPLLLRLVHHA